MRMREFGATYKICEMQDKTKWLGAQQTLVQSRFYVPPSGSVSYRFANAVYIHCTKFSRISLLRVAWFLFSSLVFKVMCFFTTESLPFLLSITLLLEVKYNCTVPLDLAAASDLLRSGVWFRNNLWECRPLLSQNTALWIGPGRAW